MVRAAVMTGPGAIETWEFDKPTAQPGSVLMRMLISGICGTDKHTFRGETIQYAGTSHERAVAFPLICGHENVGVVEETGGLIFDSEGLPLHPGDRIVPAANVPCRACFFCRNGYPYYFCSRLEDYGNSLNAAREPSLFGGWSEYMYLLPGTPIFRVPNELPDRVAVLTEEMAVTHGLDVARGILSQWGEPSFGESIAILGAGPLGLCHVAKARMLGYGSVTVIDRFDKRLVFAEKLGATLTLNVNRLGREERIEAIRAETGERGVAVVVDCTGDPSTFEECLRIVGVGGVVLEVGAFVDLGPVPVNPNRDLLSPNVTVIGIGGETARSYLPAMRLMNANQGRIPLEQMVSHVFPIEDAAQALEVSQSGAAIKVAISPAAAD